MNCRYSLALIVLIAATLAVNPVAYYSVTIPEDKIKIMVDYFNDERKKIADFIFGNTLPLGSSAFYYVDQIVGKVLDFFKGPEFSQFAKNIIQAIRKNAEDHNRKILTYNEQMADAIKDAAKIIPTFKRIKKLLFSNFEFFSSGEPIIKKGFMDTISHFETHVPKLEQMERFYRLDEGKNYLGNQFYETSRYRSYDSDIFSIVEEELYIPEYRDGSEYLGHIMNEYQGNSSLHTMASSIVSLLSMREVIKEKIELKKQDTDYFKFRFNSDISEASKIIDALSAIHKPLDEFNRLEKLQLELRKDHRQFILDHDKKLLNYFATTYNELINELIKDNDQIDSAVQTFKNQRAQGSLSIKNYGTQHTVELLTEFSKGLMNLLGRKTPCLLLLQREVVRLARKAFFISFRNSQNKYVNINNIVIKSAKNSDKQITIEQQRCQVKKLYVDPEDGSTLPPSDVPLHEDFPDRYKRKISIFTKKEMDTKGWNTYFTSKTTDEFVQLVNSKSIGTVTIDSDTCILYLLGGNDIRLDFTLVDSKDYRYPMKAELLEAGPTYLI